MARYEHLPIYKKISELAVYLDQVVAGFARRHEHGPGAGMQCGRRLGKVAERRIAFRVVRECRKKEAAK